ncbi:type IV pilus modification protein PilV [Cupriavidus sp. BIC8F]|uniref:type IV pilus modification protein PilV n=1 Tax=Cupriavidus sp. BIC8F TaxID=3079014 RepID=UPI002915DD53|nr:type IV pilus modification protein PilV [Cupriavidus sp. BIC8F]
MLTSRSHRSSDQRGISLLEVLVAIVILTIGLLGLAGLLGKVYLAEVESYQRAQALLVLNEMTERISANRAQAASYVAANPIGTGDSQPASCVGIAVGPDRDLCEWSNTLKGAAEQKASANIGAMVGARGCITQVQAPDPTLGICTPGIYLVAVAWQGMHQTAAPAITCGQGQFGTDDTRRRSIASQIFVGLPACY